MANQSERELCAEDNTRNLMSWAETKHAYNSGLLIFFVDRSRAVQIAANGLSIPWYGSVLAAVAPLVLILAVLTAVAYVWWMLIIGVCISVACFRGARYVVVEAIRRAALSNEELFNSLLRDKAIWFEQRLGKQPLAQPTRPAEWQALAFEVSELANNYAYQTPFDKEAVNNALAEFKNLLIQPNSLILASMRQRDFDAYDIVHTAILSVCTQELQSGRNHVRHGVLDGLGHAYLSLFSHALSKLVLSERLTASEADLEEGAILDAIAEAGNR